MSTGIELRAWHKEWSPKEVAPRSSKINGMEWVKGFRLSNTGIEWADLYNFKSPCRAEDLELMLNTGYKDKNRKKIFQGDIVEWFDGTRGEVKKIIFPLHGGAAGAGIHCWGTEQRALSANESGIDEQCVVIGNIYANPELLKA